MKPDRSLAVLAATWTLFLGSLVVSVALVRYVQAQPLPPEEWLPHRYIGRVTAADVHDGDTITAEIENDFDVITYARLRLAGINAPELFGPEKEAGKGARDYLVNLLAGQPVYLEVLVNRSGKPIRRFDRTVCRVWVERDGELVDVAGLLVKAGHGVAVSVREAKP